MVGQKRGLGCPLSGAGISEGRRRRPSSLLTRLSSGHINCVLDFFTAVALLVMHVLYLYMCHAHSGRTCRTCRRRRSRRGCVLPANRSRSGPGPALAVTRRQEMYFTFFMCRFFLRAHEICMRLDEAGKDLPSLSLPPSHSISLLFALSLSPSMISLPPSCRMPCSCILLG